MKHLLLNNSRKIPILGLGTWKAKPGDVGEAVRTALKAGYRHIDCAAIYFNEDEIGQALTDSFNQGICKREDIFVTSKLWIDQKDTVQSALQQSLQDLQLDYLDMYLIHWPVNVKKGVKFGEWDKDSFLPENHSETWAQMESCVQKGLTTGIGVSNYSSKRIEEILKTASIKPAINQIERHPYLQRDELVSYCRSQNIAVTAYSPLGSKDRHPSVKDENEPSLLHNEVVNAVAERNECTAGQVLLNWQIQHGCITIPKSTNAGRLKQNLEAADFSLSEDDMKQLNALEQGFRYVDARFFCPKGSPYTLDILWDGM